MSFYRQVPAEHRAIFRNPSILRNFIGPLATEE